LKKEGIIMPKSTFQRNEMKFILTKAQVDALIGKMAEYMNPDKYCTDGKHYSIYNIYYDTEDNSIVRHSISSPYYKEKLRLRSYDSPIAPDGTVYLELKKKTGGIVNKRRAAMTLREACRFIENGESPKCAGYINGQVVNEIQYFLSRNKVRPALFLCYKRMAYFGINDKAFRITLDWDITSRRNDVSLEKGCYGAKLLEENRYIMEVKIPNAVPKWLADTLAELHIYKTSFSKYGEEYLNYSFPGDKYISKPVYKPELILLAPDCRKIKYI
jgi:hypothetical protein